MAELKVLNELLYEVLADMEDLARSYLDESEEDDKELLLFLDKLKSAISKMDRKALFEDSLISSGTISRVNISDISSDSRERINCKN